MNKRGFLNTVVTVLITLVIAVPLTAVFAEQSGTTPESGVTSRLKEIYDYLVDKNVGSDDAGSWGDWGSMWNGIYSAGDNSLNYELQMLNEFDDYEGTLEGNIDPTFPVDDYEGDESVWINTLPLTEDLREVWKDERTGLYWSHRISSSITNIFPNQDHSTCPFFGGATDEEKMMARYNYDGLTAACGNAINACGSLELDANNDGIVETNWYLPSQKEFQQAYIDGIFNQTRALFVPASYFWSSTEMSGNTARAFIGHSTIGYTLDPLKTASNSVRCVTRD